MNISPKYAQLVGRLILALAILAIYGHTLKAPFIFDDLANIVGNESLRALWPLSNAFSAPWGRSGLAGRPLANFSLALNYALSGLAVWSYHLANIAIHILAAWVLFSLIRRTLAWPALGANYERDSWFLSLITALLWAIHPLQTQAVTYLSQRCESLMGLAYLTSLYLAVRGWQSPRPGPWHLGAIVAALVGAGTKEVIITLPLMVLVYDLVFVHQDIRAVWRPSRVLYPGLVLSALLVLGLSAAGGTSASGALSAPQQLMDYWLGESEVIFHYLRLVFWPVDLCLDYSDWTPAGSAGLWLYTVGLMVICAVCVWAAFRRHPAGFLGLWFVIILAPSALTPLPDMVFEHRLYLPLAGITALTVFSGYRLWTVWLDTYKDRPGWPVRSVKILGLTSLFSIILMLSVLTWLRNDDYRSSLAIWLDTAAKRPRNYRAYCGLGQVYLESGDFVQAWACFDRAISIKPDDYLSHLFLGTTMLRQGRPEEAINHLKKSVDLKPNEPLGHANLGIGYAQLGIHPEAIAEFRQALALDPTLAATRLNLQKSMAAAAQPPQ